QPAPFLRGEMNRPSRAPRRCRGRARLWRALHVHLDRFRIWYKITYRRGRVLATEGDAWTDLDAPAFFEDPGLFYHPVGGGLAASADVVLTVEAFRQGVFDMLAAASWLRSAGHTRIGLFGYSLGAYLAGLMAAVRGDWAFVVLGGAGDSPVSPILDTQL